MHFYIYFYIRSLRGSISNLFNDLHLQFNANARMTSCWCLCVCVSVSACGLHVSRVCMCV